METSIALPLLQAIPGSEARQELGEVLVEIERFLCLLYLIFSSFHRVEEMCTDVVVKLVYLPPYSPELNPIEEFFTGGGYIVNK